MTHDRFNEEEPREYNIGIDFGYDQVEHLEREAEASEYYQKRIEESTEEDEE